MGMTSVVPVLTRFGFRILLAQMSCVHRHVELPADARERVTALDLVGARASAQVAVSRRAPRPLAWGRPWQ